MKRRLLAVCVWLGFIGGIGGCSVGDAWQGRQRENLATGCTRARAIWCAATTCAFRFMMPAATRRCGRFRYSGRAGRDRCARCRRGCGRCRLRGAQCSLRRGMLRSLSAVPRTATVLHPYPARTTGSAQATPTATMDSAFPMELAHEHVQPGMRRLPAIRNFFARDSMRVERAAARGSVSLAFAGAVDAARGGLRFWTEIRRSCIRLLYL
jgi:hypothetical protein